MAKPVNDLPARATLYRLLAGAFAEEPSRDYLHALRSPQALAALTEAGLRFDADFTKAALDRLEYDLACEFTSLMASPGGCPPIESARLTGRYQQGPYFAVKETYQRAGFAVQKGKFLVFDDQLGVELLFVAALLERMDAALACGERAAAAGIEKEIKRFWALHLGRWVRGYARLVVRATHHSFYREMAKLLYAFAEQELALLKLRVDDTDGSQAIVPKSEVGALVNPDEPMCKACEWR
jgi:TorA maturation chaperone TorD